MTVSVVANGIVRLAVFGGLCVVHGLFAAERAAPTPTETQIIDYLDHGTPTILRLWPADSARNKSRNGKAESGALTDKLRVTNAEHPALLVYPPPEGVARLDAAIIHCPGGGYSYLAMANPKQFVGWMHELGVTVAILKYHTPRVKSDPTHLGPLADAQRALRVLKSQADAFGLSADKIGIAGASAGGHLAFNACLSHQEPAYDPIDDVDALSCRPAFGFLFYPAYLSQDKSALKLHPDLPADRLDTKGTPPIFITINGDDRSFVAGNLAAMLALGDKKIPAELHLWAKGGHSGCFDKYPLAEFARPGARFLVRRGIIPESLLEKSDAWLDKTVATLRKPANPTAPKPGVAPPGMGDDGLSVIDQDLRRVHGQAQPVYRLWPGDGTRADDPFKKSVESRKQRDVAIGADVTAPTLTYFPAANPTTDRCVIVFPGGGYNVLAWDHEGLKVANWLNGQGIHAFLLKYRTPRRAGLEKHQAALQDARRAIRLVRAQADAFGVAPDKIGVLGFSAGGHLAALVSTPQKTASYAPVDQYDKASPVADFSILIYPAYTTTHMTNDAVDPLLQPKQANGPTFVATAADDTFTRGQYFYLSQHLQMKTPLAYHVYENGGHGKGINPSPTAFSQWPRECARWLQDLDRP